MTDLKVGYGFVAIYLDWDGYSQMENSMTESIDILDEHKTEVGLAQALTELSDVREVARHSSGSDRFDVVNQYWDGFISPEEGSTSLGVSRSQFFRICAKARGSVNYLQLVIGKPGRKPDQIVLPYEVARMIEEMYFEHYPKAKSFAGVWDACQSEGDRRGIKRPTYYSVCRWIKQRPEKERYEMLMGKEAAEQRYAYRPGYKTTTRPLEWVQIDHTPADVLIVDSKDRTRIIGRPYLSFAICLHTRVVLGFYVSFLHPSAVTVAKLLETCVFPKDELLKGWGLRPEIWPMHGLPEVIHTDNAKEFVSQVFELNAKDYGIKVLQRPIGEKHFGGHIESLIGKKTKKLLHALPGTTGANTVERKRLESENKASITIERLRRIIALGIHAYHETKHSELNDTPAKIWAKYQGGDHSPRVLLEHKKKAFRYCFYPERPRKLITPSGIELFRRFYNHVKFESHVREKVLVKFDPYDVSYVMVQLAGKWLRAECTRNPFERSNDYERYRWERQQKGDRNGTTSEEGARSRAQLNEEVAEEKNLTSQAKRKRKREVGVADYKMENQRLDKSPGYPSDITEHTQPVSRSKKKSHTKQKLKSSKGQGNVIDINTVINRSRKTDDEDFVIYDMDRR